jgi:FkbM family methyltransferase
MKLRELRYLFQLPPILRKSVLAYSVKKVLGRHIANDERGANQALRMLAMANSKLELTGEELHWTIQLNAGSTHVVTRKYPSSDVGILFQVLGKKEYQPAIDLILKANPDAANSRLRIVDAGANVGFATLYFKSQFPKADIVSLEIDPTNLKQLRRNVALNASDHIEVFENALWKGNANLVIRKDFRDGSECSYYVDETTGPGEVEGRDLFYFMKKKGWDAIDILKIDIEGGEKYIFQEAQQADEILSKVNVLAIEIHDEFQIRDLIYEHLKRNGFVHFNHGDLTIAHRPFRIAK